MTPCTVVHQVPLSMGFPRQECWSGLSCPSAGDLPNPGIETAPPAWQVGSLPLSHQGSPSVLVAHLSSSGFILFVDEGTPGREARLCPHLPAPGVEGGS